MSGISGTEVDIVVGVAMVAVADGVEELRKRSRRGNVLVYSLPVIVSARKVKACGFEKRLGSCKHLVASRSDVYTCLAMTKWDD